MGDDNLEKMFDEIRKDTPKEPPSQKDLSRVRQQACEVLRAAEQDGSLEMAIGEVRGASPKMAAPKKDLIMIRQQAQELLTTAIMNRSLETVIRELYGTCNESPVATCDAAVDNDDPSRLLSFDRWSTNAIGKVES